MINFMLQSGASKELPDLMDILQNILDATVEFAPRIIFAIIIFIVGWILAKIVSMVFARVLKGVGADKLGDYMKTEVDAFRNMEITLSKAIGKLIYYLLMLVVLTVSAEYLGVDSIKSGIMQVLGYVPKLLSGAIFFIAGLVIAGIIRRVADAALSATGLPAAKFISTFIYYFILILVSVSALNQTGINTELINDNVTIALGAIVIAFAIGYGFASKDLMANMLSAMYSRDKFTVGQIIRIDDISGRIVAKDNNSVTLDAGDRHVVIPIRKLISETIEILPEG